jgi:hypothetical protein
MEGGIGHPPVLRRALHVKVSLTDIEPWQGVTRAIELRELQFVHRRDEVVVGIIIIRSHTTAVGSAPMRLIAHGGLHPGDSDVQRDLLLGPQHAFARPKTDQPMAAAATQ